MHPTEKRSALEVVHTVLHAGGKFEKSAYKVSGGLHGVGASVVNALSDEFEVEVRKNGKIYFQRYERGIPKTKVEERGAASTTGTKTTFSPNPKIFPEVKFKYEIIARYLREMAYLNAGLRVRLKDERSGKEEEFHYEGGIAEFVESLSAGNETLHEVIFFKGTREGTEVEVALQWTDAVHETIFSYANNIHTIEGGTHLSGFKAALTRTLNNYGAKNKVESGVGHAQRTPLKGLRFESLKEAQAYLDHWEQRWADTRIHGTTKRQVAAMFSEEKPALLPLPLEPFRYYQYGERIVHLDGCVEVEAAYYGAPPGWIGRVVRVQWDGVFVRLLDPKTGQLLREHVRQKRGWYRIQEEDRPKRTPLRTSQLLWRAGRAGSHIGALCDAIHRQQGEVGVRRILGVLSLAKKYGAAAADEACATALEMGVQEYRFVRRYLERCPQAPLTLQQVDPLIRELVPCRDLINYRTKEAEE